MAKDRIGFGSLTPRECEILLAYVRHGTYRGIGAELTMAMQTVKNHASIIIHKLDVASLGQAAILYDRWVSDGHGWPEHEQRSGYERRHGERRKGERRSQ